MTRIPLAAITPGGGGCDCPTCPFYTQNPAAFEPVCSGSNSDCSYCGCTRSLAGDCGECPVRCRSRIDLTAWLADVGGTVGFDDIDLPDLELPAGLPRFVPQVETTELAELDGELRWPAYAVGLRRVISEATHEPYPSWRATTAHAALGLASGRLTVLVGYGKDPLVEAIWARRHRLYEIIAAHRWDLVLAPNYSAYGNLPRTEMLLNFRRNLLIAQEMLEAGINAVPNIYSFRLEDLQRYETWLAETQPPAIAVNLQTQRDDETFFELVRPALAYLALALPDDTRVIVTGSSRPTRLAELASLFGTRLVVVSQNPIAYARRGAVMTTAGRQDLHARPSDAFAANVRFYASILAQAGQEA